MVVAIIGVLASVVLASLNSARLKARNAARLSGIHTLVNAFNLGLVSSFPSTGGWYCISLTCYGTWSTYTADATVDAFLAPNLSFKPSDPSDSSRIVGGYMYRNQVTGYVSGYDGFVFPSGAYIDWTMELPVNSTSCAGGRILGVRATYIECLFQLD